MDGMFKMTSKNFSKTPNKAASGNAGFGSKPGPEPETTKTSDRI